MHSVQNLTDQVRLGTYSDNALSTDSRMTSSRSLIMNTADSEAAIPSSSAKLSAPAVVSSTVSPAVYDPALVHSYLAQVQGYIPGIPCSAQQCSTCYPVLDSAGYVNNASPSAVQQPMLLTRPLLGGVGSTGGETAPSTCYVWVGQDAEAQKQMYQTQLTLSQLNLNSVTPSIPQSYGVQPECSTGMSFVAANTTGEPPSAPGPLVNSVSFCPWLTLNHRSSFHFTHFNTRHRLSAFDCACLLLNFFSVNKVQRFRDWYLRPKQEYFNSQCARLVLCVPLRMGASFGNVFHTPFDCNQNCKS